MAIRNPYEFENEKLRRQNTSGAIAAMGLRQGGPQTAMNVKSSIGRGLGSTTSPSGMPGGEIKPQAMRPPARTPWSQPQTQTGSWDDNRAHSAEAAGGSKFYGEGASAWWTPQAPNYPQQPRQGYEGPAQVPYAPVTPTATPASGYAGPKNVPYSPLTPTFQGSGTVSRDVKEPTPGTGTSGAGLTPAQAPATGSSAQALNKADVPKTENEQGMIGGWSAKELIENTSIPQSVLEAMAADGYLFTVVNGVVAYRKATGVDQSRMGDPNYLRNWIGESPEGYAQSGDPTVDHYAKLGERTKSTETPFDTPYDPPPQMDPAETERMNQLTRQGYAMQQGRAMRGALEMGARSGAGADQMAGQAGDVSQAYALASEAEVNRQRMQVQVQNFAAEMDHYNKEFQREMARAMALQGTAEATAAFQRAQLMAAQGESAQKRLIRLQHDLENQITGKDILGGLLGGAFQLGGAALGGYLGGLGYGAATGGAQALTPGSPIGGGYYDGPPTGFPRYV